jgi:hypothetical protein
MVKYADIKSKKLRKRLFRWLVGTGEISIEEGSKHTKIEHIRTGKKYTIPTSHNVVNKHIVKGLMKWLIVLKVCKQEEFDNHL